MYYLKVPKKWLKVKNAGQNIKTSFRWVVVITLSTFILSITISSFTSGVVEDVKMSFSLIMLLFIVLLGIVFDIIGVAVTTASEPPFHSMASDRVKGASESVSIIRYSQQISNFFNDVIGDISSIISGALMASIVTNISAKYNINLTLTSLIVTGIVASVMVGGKAIGKGIAVKQNNLIVYILGYLFYLFKKLIPKKFKIKRKNKGRKNNA